MSFRLTLRWTQSWVSVSLINSQSLDIDCSDARRLQIAGKTRPGLASRRLPLNSTQNLRLNLVSRDCAG